MGLSGNNGGVADSCAKIREVNKTAKSPMIRIMTISFRKLSPVSGYLFAVTGQSNYITIPQKLIFFNKLFPGEFMFAKGR